MTKRIIAFILVLAVLPIISLPTVSYADDTLFFEAYTDGWNGFGTGRYAQNTVLRMKLEQPWTYIGTTTTSAENGGEGVLPQNWDTYDENGQCVYWVQSAVFPDNDVYVQCADTSLDDVYFLPKGTTTAAVRGSDNSAPQSFTGSVKYEIKVRFDDYNANRYIFTPYTKSSGTYNEFLWFDKNGKVYVMCIQDGVATAAEICSWVAGEWYNVELKINFDYESISVSVNGGNQIVNAQARNMCDWTYLMLLSIKHNNHEVSQREFSNSYISGAKGYYLSESMPAPEPSGYYYTLDFTWNKQGISRVGQDAGSLQLNARQPWTYSGVSTDTNVGSEGMLPFEDEYRGSKMIYLLRTGVWPTDDTETVKLADNSVGLPKACTIFNYINDAGLIVEAADVRESNTVSWEMKLRFDDINSIRKIFSPGHIKEGTTSTYEYTDFITFNRDGTVTVRFQNGDNTAEVTGGSWQVGKWHSAKLVLDLERNVFDFYLDKTPIVTNVLAICNMSSFKRIKLMQQEHTTAAAQLSKREFSNSYIDFVKAKYITDRADLWTEKGNIAYQNGKYSGEASITNINSKDNPNINCFLALYNENDDGVSELVGIKSTTAILNGVGTKNVSLSVPYADNSAKAKLIIMRSDSLAPVPAGTGVSTYVPDYYYTLDFTDNNSGYSRGSYSNVICCERDYVWNYIGTQATTAKNDKGGEGMLPFDSTYTLGSKRVYWIKTGVWPTGDTGQVRGADQSSKPIIVPSKGSPSLFIGNAGSANSLLEAETDRKSNILDWEMRVRFDDKNADRYLFRMRNHDGSSYDNGTPFIMFDKDGNFKVIYKTAEGNVTAQTQWTAGQWYNVRLRMNLSENTFSVYLNDNVFVENVDAVNGVDFDGWARIHIIEHSHQTNSNDITEREFSNTYIDFLRAQYIE